jgi:hypothetical protein
MFFKLKDNLYLFTESLRYISIARVTETSQCMYFTGSVAREVIIAWAVAKYGFCVTMSVSRL